MKQEKNMVRSNDSSAPETVASGSLNDRGQRAVSAEVPLTEVVSWLNSKIQEARADIALCKQIGHPYYQCVADQNLRVLGALLKLTIEAGNRRGTGADAKLNDAVRSSESST